MVGQCVALYHFEWLTPIMRFVSWFGDGVYIPIALSIVTALFFWFKKDKFFAIIMICAPLLGQIVKYLLKNFFQVPRPEVFGCEVLTAYADRYSFPSGHTIFYTIFFGLLAYYALKHLNSKKAAFVLTFSLLAVTLVGYSRVYLGAHWYLDIAAGYLVGGAILAAAIFTYQYLHNYVILNRVKDPVLDSSVRPQNDGEEKK